MAKVLQESENVSQSVFCRRKNLVILVSNFQSANMKPELKEENSSKRLGLTTSYLNRQLEVAVIMQGFRMLTFNEKSLKYS